jgi:hypothetical protein
MGKRVIKGTRISVVLIFKKLSAGQTGEVLVIWRQPRKYVSRQLANRLILCSLQDNSNFLFSMVTLKCMSALSALNTFRIVSIVALFALLSSFEI